MTTRKRKFMASPFLGFGYSFLAILGYTILVLAIVVSPRSFERATSFTKFVMIFMLGILPTLNWIFLIHRGFSIVEFTRQGVTQSLFKIFRKKSFRWEEIKELRAFQRVNIWLFVSKIETAGMTYDQMVTNKDIIQIEYSDEVVFAIREFCSMEIRGLTQ